MIWKEIVEVREVDKCIESSHKSTKIIFKHSTACPISKIAYDRMSNDQNWAAMNQEVYLVYVIEQRTISNYIESKIGVKHQSPQVIVLRNGNCIYNESHLMIKPHEVQKLI